MFLGDIHLDTNTKGLCRTQEITDILCNIRDEFIKGEYDMLIQLGDVFTPRNNKIPYYIHVLDRIFNSFSTRGLVRSIVGNHDVVDMDYTFLKYPVSSLLPLERQGITISTIESEDINEDWEVIYLPYMLNSFTKTVYGVTAQENIDNETNYIIKNSRANNIIVCSHLNVEGATIGQEQEIPRGSDLYLPECCIKSDKVKYIFNGHYHKKQQIGKIYMPGSVVRLDMGEKNNDTGYFMLEI